MDKVDILLPIYNGEKFLEEQIKSLLRQTHKNISILVRDDGSTDQSKDIIDSLAKADSRIIVVNDENGNLGLVANINFLLGISDADYIMYCDQDDVWFDDKIEILMREMQKRELDLGKQMPILVHSDCYITNENLEIRGRFKGTKALKYGLEKSLFKFYVQGASALLNKALMREIYPFINNVYLHDRYTHLCAEIAGRRFYLNSPLMYYRQHSSNLVGSSNLMTKLKNIFSPSRFVFFQIQDRKLIESLSNEKYVNNDLLKAYLEITSDKTSLFEKLKILRFYNISMRLKEFFIMSVKF
ncbi:glycosyltransferase family 2 protein [Flavobacterium mesophilum]|uniref:glycosyltransferase family 2 protein n=1 Tax=Flavobacterium mesophilum TaxID=3143495 RepID=UPI0031CDBCB6